MSEAFWEQAVGLWLTRHRSVFVSPSYNLGAKGDWASLDFLAVDFAERNLWAVEVTTGSNAEKILGKATIFNEQYVPRIREALKDSGDKHAVVPIEEEWPIGLWAFVQETLVEKVQKKFVHQGLRPKVTALEEIAFPWSKNWWSDRFR